MFEFKIYEFTQLNHSGSPCKLSPTSKKKEALDLLRSAKSEYFPTKQFAFIAEPCMNLDKTPIERRIDPKGAKSPLTSNGPILHPSQ